MKRTPSIKRLCAEWLNSADGRGLETRRKNSQALDHLVEVFGKRSINTLTVADAKSLAGRMAVKNTQGQLSKGTISKRLQTIKQFGQWCCDADYVGFNPFAILKPGNGKPDATKKRFVSDQEVDKLLNTIESPEWRLVVVMARYCGLRIPSELVGLKWEHVEWDLERIRIVQAKTVARLCPLFHRYVLRELKALRKSLDRDGNETEMVFGRWDLHSKSNLRTGLNRMIARAGLAPWPRVFHNQRASRCTELLNDKGLSAKEVATYMGNSPAVIMEHYEVMRPSTRKRICKL